MEFIREPHTCTWAEDAATAQKLCKLLQENYYEPEKNYEVMKEYLAENVCTHKFPPEKNREGYGSRNVWLTIEHETRKQSIERDAVKKERVKHVNYSTVGSAILLDEYRVLKCSDGTLAELHHFSVTQIYNGKIVGYYMWNDPVPPELATSKDDQVDAIMAMIPERLDPEGMPYADTDYE